MGNLEYNYRKCLYCRYKRSYICQFCNGGIYFEKKS